MLNCKTNLISVHGRLSGGGGRGGGGGEEEGRRTRGTVGPNSHAKNRLPALPQLLFPWALLPKVHQVRIHHPRRSQ